MTKKIGKYFLFYILASLTFTGCFSPWKGDEATLTLFLGGTGSRAAVIPDDLAYEIELDGPTVRQSHTAEGNKPLTFKIAPGHWNITVKAYQEEALYAEGSGGAEIKSGQDNQVEITMSLVNIVPSDYTVTFETYGGVPVPVPQTITHGGTVTKPQAIYKEGFTFAGWYSDPDFNTEYNFNTPVTGSFTLHAKWEEEDSKPVNNNGIGIKINFLLDKDELILEEEYKDIVISGINDKFTDHFDAKVNGIFKDIQWFIWGLPVSGSKGKGEITINANDYNAGTNELTVMVIDENNVPYSATITFEVADLQ
jgi:uncharacterized repeat protein (TIGR02543 family)